jgi:cytochrome c553
VTRALLPLASSLALGWGGLSRAGASDGVAFFETEVRPLLAERCLECHSTSGKRKGGLALDNAAGWRRGGDSGPAAVPGDPEQSLLLEAVRYGNRELQMPPDGKLPEREIAALARWIAMGAPDPRQGEREVAENPASPKGEDHWAFRPLADPAVPRVADMARVGTPVDAFWLAALEKAGLRPAPEAPPEVLVRRTAFLLTGLPPDPADVDRLASDPSPRTWDDLVERWLASPQYGVRWGRHWLDVARYADSNGLDENLAFGQAWRYRDYVIDSWNEDKPFDRFLVEQIAGDLLPEADAATRTATGFLALGARVLAEPDVEKLHLDVIDEQLDTLGKAFLGMTLGCARCHDHKFDPVTQADYYGMAAIFKGSRNFAASNTGAIKHWYEHSLATAAEAERARADEARVAEARKKASAFQSGGVARLRREARERVADYLVAAAGLGPGASLREAEQAAAPAGLHPWILHHARLHLEYHRTDPLFAPWHELAGAGDREGLRKLYGPWFAEAEAAWVELRKREPEAKVLPEERLERARAALLDPSGLLAVPSEPEKAFDAATVAELRRLEEEARVVESSAYDAPAAMGVGEGDAAVAEMAIHIRGSHQNLGRAVPRAVPAAFAARTGQPSFPADRSGRLELARWMVHPDHPLTARVIVNRIWRWHFGTGLVASTENFGLTGDTPSHPELLDWLARRFIESGWSVKEMHRLLLRSSLYRTDSIHPEPGAAEEWDAENRLLWRFPRQRIEAEALRDAVLAVSGQLDLSLGGKTIPLRNRQMVFNHTSKDHTTYALNRRSAYLPVVRNHVADVLAQFDYPDPTMPTGSRNRTVVAPQALFLLNAPLLIEAADALAAASTVAGTSPERRIEWIYRRALGRMPEDAERVRALEWLYGSGSDQAWPMWCQALLASNEFSYLR